MTRRSKTPGKPRATTEDGEVVAPGESPDGEASRQTSGERSVLDELGSHGLEKLWKHLFHKAHSRTHDVARAKDLVQEAMARLQQCPPKNFADRDSMYAYGTRVISNQFQQHLRRTYREAPPEDGDTPSFLESNDILANDRLEEILRPRMSNKNVRAFILKHVYGKKHAEIAREMGISEDTARQRAKRGRELLVAELRKVGIEGGE